MRYVFRVLALLFVVPATLLFIYWVGFSFIPGREPRWIRFTISLLCAGGVGWFLWNILGSIQSSGVSTVLSGGLIVGGIAFCIGFFGPIILSPESPQGPMVGLFITGPLGFLLGSVGGFIYWLIKRKKGETPPWVKNEL
jgi:hypothetical protein